MMIHDEQGQRWMRSIGCFNSLVKDVFGDKRNPPS